MKPGDEVADGGCPGLRARAGAGGVAWTMSIRTETGRLRVIIGRWPEVGVPEARRLAAEAKAKAQAPVVKQDDRPTLEQVIDLYGELGDPPKSWPDIKHRTKMVFAPALSEPVTTPEALQKVADAYPARGQASVAVRYLKPILKWAGKRGYTPKGIGLELEQPQKVRTRDRVLSDQELMQVLPVLGQTGHDGAIRMMLLTACRREEVCGMRFEDIIEDVWYVPGEIRKNGEEHVVPLTVDAQTVIGAQGRTSGLVFLGDRGKPLVNWDRYQKKLFERTGTEGWHRHDLRRTAATLLGKNGVPPYVIEMVLGHKNAHNDLASVYNKSRYEKEVEEALQLLSDLLSGLEIKGRSAVVTR